MHAGCAPSRTGCPASPTSSLHPALHHTNPIPPDAPFKTVMQIDWPVYRHSKGAIASPAPSLPPGQPAPERAPGQRAAHRAGSTRCWRMAWMSYSARQLGHRAGAASLAASSQMRCQHLRPGPPQPRPDPPAPAGMPAPPRPWRPRWHQREGPALLPEAHGVLAAAEGDGGVGGVQLLGAQGALAALLAAPPARHGGSRGRGRGGGEGGGGGGGGGEREGAGPGMADVGCWQGRAGQPASPPPGVMARGAGAVGACVRARVGGRAGGRLR